MERNFEHIEPGNQGIPPSSEESFKIPDSGLEAEPSLSDQLEGIVQKYLKELIKDFQSKAMSWSEYCNLVYDAEEEFLKNPDYSEEIKKMGRLLFMSAVVIESAFARNRKTKISPVSKEEEFKRNPALREAKWFIEMARHYYYEPMGIEDGHGAKRRTKRFGVIPVIHCFLDTFKNISRKTGGIEKDIEGIIRGFKGLVGFMNALHLAKCEIILPTPDQDAVQKIDLQSFDPSRENERILWQIKTSSLQQTTFIGNAKKDFHAPNNDSKEDEKFDEDIRKLAIVAEEMSTEDLTYIPKYIIIPEHLINEKSFAPDRELVQSIKHHLH